MRQFLSAACAAGRAGVRGTRSGGSGQGPGGGAGGPPSRVILLAQGRAGLSEGSRGGSGRPVGTAASASTAPATPVWETPASAEQPRRLLRADVWGGCRWPTAVPGGVNGAGRCLQHPRRLTQARHAAGTPCFLSGRTDGRTEE